MNKNSHSKESILYGNFLAFTETVEQSTENINEYIEDKTKKICIFCGILFNSDSLGKLECMFHPKELNPFTKKYPRGHFDCCGMSRTTLDLFHNDNEMIPGCTKIDHISSIEEKKNIIEIPFILIPTKLYDQMSDNKRRILCREKAKLKKPYQFNTANGEYKQINLKDYYDDMLTKYSFNMSDQAIGLRTIQTFILCDDSLEIDYQDVPEGKIIMYNYNQTTFIPFYIIRRCNSKPEISLLLKHRTSDTCNF